MAQLKYLENGVWVAADTIPQSSDTNPGLIRVYNGLDQVETGFALDASQGKILWDQIEILGNNTAIFNDIPSSALVYLSSATNLYGDNQFKAGNNSVSVYNNSSNGTVTVTRTTSSDVPNLTGYCLEIKTTGTASPGSGGFVQTLTSAANYIFYVVYLVKLPVGWELKTASNSMGTGYVDGFITDTTGTGEWKYCVRRVVCGSSGTFSSGGHVYAQSLNGIIPTASSPLIWYLGGIWSYRI